MVGAVVNAASPINLVISTLMPEALVGSTLANGSDGLFGALLIGGVIAAVIYCCIVYGMHASMKKSFMMTVRRLAGTK